MTGKDSNCLCVGWIYTQTILTRAYMQHMGDYMIRLDFTLIYGAIYGMCIDDVQGFETTHTLYTTEKSIYPSVFLDYSASRRLTLYNRFENSGLKALTPPKDAPSNTHSTIK